MSGYFRLSDASRAALNEALGTILDEQQEANVSAIFASLDIGFDVKDGAVRVVVEHQFSGSHAAQPLADCVECEARLWDDQPDKLRAFATAFREAADLCDRMADAATLDDE